MVVEHMAFACLTKHCEDGFGNETAIQWIHKDLLVDHYSFFRFETESNQMANVLHQYGIKPGDVVSLFLPRSPEVITSFFAILKLQAYACILFSTLGEDALLERLVKSGTKLIITTKYLLRKVIAIKDRLPALKGVWVFNLEEHASETIYSMSALLKNTATTFDYPHFVEDEFPAFLQYTSGSTGKPKAALHVHGAIEDILRSYHEIMKVEKDDVYWCTADPAWITGLVYGIIAPFSSRTNVIQFGGGYHAATWLRILADQKVNIWYTAPTALRMMMQESAFTFKDYDLSDLKRIYSVGEPLNPEIYSWGKKVLKKEIYDTWFQSETGSIMIANRPGLRIKAGSMGVPRSGIDVIILNDNMEPLPEGFQGHLCLQKGWGSMFRSYFHSDSTYQQKFHHQYYITGDLAKKDHDGYYWYISRSDDVINTGGHLVGPFEVESALLEIEEITDVAVIGANDPLLHQKIIAYLVLRDGIEWTKQLELKCRIYVSDKVSTIAIPSEFHIIDLIPKNQSGKILRRLLKAKYEGDDPGDLSTMEKI